jgi:hypothetical protein
MNLAVPKENVPYPLVILNKVDIVAFVWSATGSPNDSGLVQNVVADVSLPPSWTSELIKIAGNRAKGKAKQTTKITQEAVYFETC